MQPQGAWGGGIWGANAQKASPVALKEGEDACTICHEHPLELCIIPCKHEFCGPCVNRLRKANVFKVWKQPWLCILTPMLLLAASQSSEASIVCSAGGCRHQVPIVPPIRRGIRPFEGWVSLRPIEHLTYFPGFMLLWRHHSAAMSGVQYLCTRLPCAAWRMKALWRQTGLRKQRL